MPGKKQRKDIQKKSIDILNAALLDVLVREFSCFQIGPGGTAFPEDSSEH